MTDDELAAKIAAECMFGDEEADHSRADDLVIAHLRSLGFTKSADAWEAVDKWYA